MLKNKTVREQFILNDENWKEIDFIKSLKIRVLELKLNSHLSLIKFEKQLTEEDIKQYYYIHSNYVPGDYVPYDWGSGKYYRMVDGELATYSAMSLNRAVELVKDTQEDE